MVRTTPGSRAHPRTPWSAPLVPPGRLVGLDVARCLALLGMIATHALVTRAPDGGVTVVQAVAGGRSSALFAVLAGVSLSLMSGGTTPLRGLPLSGARAALAVRAVLIAVIGLLLGSLDTTIAVILTSYGLLFLLGLPFLRLGAPSLAAAALVWAALAPVLSHLLRPLLPEPSYASPTLEGLGAPLHLGSELLFTGYYPAFVWLAYLLAGMALGRLVLTRGRVALAVGAVGAVLATAAWTASAALLATDGVTTSLAGTLTGPQEPGGLADALEHGTYGVTPTGSWWWLAVHAPHSGTPFDLLHTTGTALAVIAGCLLVARLAPRSFAVVFGAGAMTLTLYSLHVVLRIPPAWPEDDVATFARHVTLVLVVGALYRLARRRGPLERLVGVLTDPLRRASGQDLRRASGQDLRRASGQDGGQH